MTSFLLLISFSLHIITLFIIYKLIQRFRTLKNNETSTIESMFNEYLEAFKEENQRLQTMILEESKKVPRLEKDEIEVKKSDNQQQLNKKEPFDNVQKQDVKYSTHPFIAELLPNENDGNDRIELSLQSKILDLYKRGWKEEDIAKELNCGKTEVVLTIKMDKNIEQNT